MPRLWIFSDLHQDWADNAWDPSTHAPVLSHSHTAQLQLDGPHRSPTYSHGHCGRLFVPFAESWTSRCIFVLNFFNEIGIDLRKNYGPRHTNGRERVPAVSFCTPSPLRGGSASRSDDGVGVARDQRAWLTPQLQPIPRSNRSVTPPRRASHVDPPHQGEGVRACIVARIVSMTVSRSL